MGLDMYLHAERYVSSKALFDEDDPSNFAQLLETYGEGGVAEAAVAVSFPSANVAFTVAYWRKANQIHSWFVRECQDGRDECQKTYVPREKLDELRSLCLRVLAEKDEDLYDDWYWQDLKSTVKQLDRVLSLPDNWTIYYRSSW